MALSKKKKKLITGFSIGIMTGIVVALITKNLGVDFFDGLEKETYDYRYGYKYILGKDSEKEIKKGSIESMVIVDIDERAMSKFGNYNKWPRSHHGKVVDELSKNGASSVIFDIMFKTADFGATRTDEVMKILNNSTTDTDWEGLKPAIKHGLNHDSMLVESLKKSDVVIGAALMNSPSAYQNPSSWKHLSTEEWHNKLSPQSTGDFDRSIHSHFKTMSILDNIFLEFGQATERVGLVNVIPDEDGVHRRIPLLYNFPADDPEIKGPQPKHTYPVIALQGCLMLLGKTLKEVEIVPGEYMNLGAPLRIFRKNGALQTSYPNLTIPMIEQIINNKKEIDLLTAQNPKELIITSPIIALKDEDGALGVELMGQYMIEEILNPLLENKPAYKDIKKVTEEEPLMITETLGFYPIEDETSIFLLMDSESEEEVEIDSLSLYILYNHWPAGKIAGLEPDQSLIITGFLSLRYNEFRQNLSSQMLVLTEDVVKKITSLTMDRIEALEEGKQLGIGRDIKIPIDDQGRMLLNYQGKGGKGELGADGVPLPGTFRYISYYDVIAKRHDPTFYQGKTFLLGSSAAALFDIVASTFDEKYPGVEIHATAIYNIMTQNFMRKMSSNSLLVILVMLGLVIGLVTYFLPILWAVLTLLLMSFAYIAVAFIQFDQNLWIEIARPEITIFTTFLFVLMARYFFEERDKKFLNDAFKNYISPELIDQMVDSGSKPSLGGTEAILSAYFTDIQAFSTFSEKLGSPTKLVELLNEYLTEMTDILLLNQGTLDKYEGDAIIAFFGAPVALEEHAFMACQSGLMMQDKLKELREKWQTEGDKWPEIVHNMRMRVGVNTGPIVTGNMGSRVRMNYTMMGDTVNLAARLESAAKQYGVFTMVSAETLDMTGDKILSRELDLVQVVGKSEPVRIYELMSMMDKATDTQKKCREVFASGLALYRAQKWDEAIAVFEDCKQWEEHHPDRAPGCKTTPSHVFIDRCNAYKTDRRLGLPADWDGVYTATEK